MVRFEIFHPWVQLSNRRVLGLIVADRGAPRAESRDKVLGRQLGVGIKFCALEPGIERRLVSSGERFLGFLVDNTRRPELEVLDGVLKSRLDITYVNPNELRLNFEALVRE